MKCEKCKYYRELLELAREFILDARGSYETYEANLLADKILYLEKEIE